MRYLEIECFFFLIKIFINDKSGIISYYYREERRGDCDIGKGGGEASG